MSSRRASLRILWSEDGMRHVMPPGSTLIVGRDSACDVVVRRDEEVSREHFEIRWDGSTGVLLDRESQRGTTVQGEPAREATALRHRTWVRAGTTDFVFEIEGDPFSRDLLERHATALATLGPIADAGDLWAVVDASRGDAVRRLLERSMDSGRSLYEGIPGAALDAVAPYLIHVEPSSRLLDGLLAEGLASRAALFLASSSDERALRRHFRRFLVVQAEGIGPRTYFRFYDPAVFSEFWAMATPLQRAELSREVDRFWVVRDAGDLACFEHDRPA